MKKLMILSLILLLLLAACAPGGQTAAGEAAPVLTVGDGRQQKRYTAADLQALSQAEATFKGVAYTGVPVNVLLEAGGFVTTDLKAVKAVASDGYSVNYDVTQLQNADVIVAYARADGPLAEEDGAFRMVLPQEEGKLNVRMLVEIQVIP